MIHEKTWAQHAHILYCMLKGEKRRNFTGLENVGLQLFHILHFLIFSKIMCKKHGICYTANLRAHLSRCKQNIYRFKY